jgi:hypothetical protein
MKVRIFILSLAFNYIKGGQTMTSKSIIFKLWKPTEEKRLKNKLLLYQSLADTIKNNKSLKRDYNNYINASNLIRRELEELKNESTSVIKST